MPTTWYDTINGEMIGENTNGVQTDYFNDPLGTPISFLDNGPGRNEIGTFRAKPYGDTLYTAGFVGAFRWVGSLGYRQTGLAWSDYYVRARHYGTAQGQWTTVDPLWPDESAYGYGRSRPSTLADPSGTYAGTVQECTYTKCEGGICIPKQTRISQTLADLSRKLDGCMSDPKSRPRIEKCLSNLGVKNPGDLLTCILNNLKPNPKSLYRIRCSTSCKLDSLGRNVCAWTHFNTRDIEICYIPYIEVCGVCPMAVCVNLKARCSDFGDTLIHETAHSCGILSDGLQPNAASVAACIGTVCGVWQK